MYRLIAIIIVWLVGCTSNNNKETNKVQQRSTPLNFLPLKYDSSKSFMDNIDSGYVHFFTVNNQAFKIEKKKTDSSDIAVFYKKGDGWIENFVEDYNNRGFNWRDVNGDNNDDFEVFQSRFSIVYFYNNDFKSFFKEPIEIYCDYELIDTLKKLYYEHWPGMSNGGVINLFKFKNNSKEIIYFLKWDYKNNNPNKTFWVLRNNKNKIITRFSTIQNHWEFDYETFWRNYLKNKTIVLKTRND